MGSFGAVVPRLIDKRSVVGAQGSISCSSRRRTNPQRAAKQSKTERDRPITDAC